MKKQIYVTPQVEEVPLKAMGVILTSPPADPSQGSGAPRQGGDFIQ